MIIPGNIFLAPMAGFTNVSFRSICLEKGAFFTFTEMVSIEACARKSEKTLHFLDRPVFKWNNLETIVGVQIFGAEPCRISPGLREIARYAPSLIDLNCGCSIPKILKTGSGAALLKNPRKIGEMLSAITAETDVPVTLKIRSGWDADHLNYLETGFIAEESGASLITIHPRTRSALFSGQAEWNHIKELKQKLKIPVIGSGDLFTPEDVYRMLATTGCDGVMIARGAIGNPFIFSQTVKLLSKGSYEKTIPLTMKLECAINHLERDIAIKGEERACIEMRKHFCAYTKGLPGSAFLRKSIVKARTKRDYKSMVDDYLMGD
ncbi:MAG: tRNA dihydrouridine synthase DusB [Spirochaetales bacterium]|nr:tRNA dihydrouridine synthase DusB [Spirochaetales bacterium]